MLSRSARIASRAVAALPARVAAAGARAQPAKVAAFSATRGSVAFQGARRWLSAASGNVTMDVPSMGDSISEGTLVEWMKAPGDWVDEDEVIAMIETDKVTIDVHASCSGVVVEHKAEEQDNVEVGAALVVIDTSAEKPAGGEPAKKEEAAAPKKEEAAAPKKEEAAAPKKEAAAPAAAPKKEAAAPAAAPKKEASGERSERRVKMNRMRSRIAQRLKDAQNETAMLTTFQEVDMSALMALRKTHKDAFEAKYGSRMGFMGAFIKASAQMLVDIPAVNAVIEGGDVIYRDYVDVSVAVASPRGLVVPVLRNVESKNIAEIELELADLANRARSDQIALEDMAGGTFTISNGGVFGSLMGTPIINMPQSAVLGMHATKPRAVVVDGQVVARPMMYLALTYDHRLIDGREAATFLVGLRERIQDPARMLLDL
ncbi:hypothetical protein FNF27_03643 [Cafeteria roenbergensis]|uniref:dihydrolipoyllysine-residue succinyltransferase n=1 Tax=Cafeteria roenbergensis TaxID=33653 RepID=A0A5A8ECB4_CAFRO|nr:hypothetical protein FNF27_03643 [Cafeteria roenbergensis]